MDINNTTNLSLNVTTSKITRLTTINIYNSGTGASLGYLTIRDAKLESFLRALLEVALSTAEKNFTRQDADTLIDVGTGTATVEFV